MLLRAAVVQTLTQIDGVDDVRFFIEDEPLKDQHGRELGAMNAEDFVENTGSSFTLIRLKGFGFIFRMLRETDLAQATVKVRYNSNTSREKVIVEKILKGPGKDRGNFPVISPNTEVRSVSVKDGICYVNFNEEFLNTDYKVDPYVTIYALVNSIVENCATGQVQILVNGETKVQYQSSVDLSQPFAADYDYVEKKIEKQTIMQCVPDGISDFFHRNDGRRQSVLSRACAPEMKKQAGKKFRLPVRYIKLKSENLIKFYILFYQKTSRILVYDDAKQPVQIGNKVNVKGELSFEEARNQGNFDQKFYYEKTEDRSLPVGRSSARDR